MNASLLWLDPVTSVLALCIHRYYNTIIISTEPSSSSNIGVTECNRSRGITEAEPTEVETRCGTAGRDCIAEPGGAVPRHCSEPMHCANQTFVVVV